MPDGTQAPSTGAVTAVRFAIAEPVRPGVTRAVAIGDLARRAALAHFGRSAGGGLSPILSGKLGTGEPLKGHGHSHFLPTDEDGDCRLDHLTVWAPAGLGPQEVAALGALAELREAGGGAPLLLSLLARGDARVLPRRLRGPACVWQSASPFVPARHPKVRRGRAVDTPVEQVVRELAQRGLGAGLLAVGPVEELEEGPRAVPWGVFEWQRGEHSPPIAAGFGWRLYFRHEVEGPLVLGTASHFGLGLFITAG